MTATLPPDDPHETHPLHLKAKKALIQANLAAKAKEAAEKAEPEFRPVENERPAGEIADKIRAIREKQSDESDWHKEIELGDTVTDDEGNARIVTKKTMRSDPPKPKDVNTFSGREWFMVGIIVGFGYALICLTWGGV